MKTAAANWHVLLLGGASGIGKSMVAARLGRRLGVPWLQVDDLRLALERSGFPVPDSALVPTFSEPGGLITVAELLAPAIEAVIENHVDQRNPTIIEGDGLLPSIWDRPSVQERAAGGRVRALFLFEPEPSMMHKNMQARQVGHTSEAHARKNWLYSEWLWIEAERRHLPILAVRPWETLEQRILDIAGPPETFEP